MVPAPVETDPVRLLIVRVWWEGEGQLRARITTVGDLMMGQSDETVTASRTVLREQLLAWLDRLP